MGFSGVERSTHGLVLTTRVSPNLPHLCTFGSSQWGSIIVLPGDSRNYLCYILANWPFSYDRFLFSVRDSQEIKPRHARQFSNNVLRGSGEN